VNALAADDRPAVIVLPDLHNATEPEALADLIDALLPLQHVRILAETTDDDPRTERLRAHGPAVMNLDHDQWTDPARAGREPARIPPAPVPVPAPFDPDDPAHVVQTDPGEVTARYTASEVGHGGLRTAWLRAGQALTAEPDPAVRALILRAALRDDADPRHTEELAPLAAGAPWHLVWNRGADDIVPPWPGPTLALATGHGKLDGFLLALDHQGTVRILNAADATPNGRLPRPFGPARTLAALSDGTVLTLDGQGRLDEQQGPRAPQRSGIAALLETSTSPARQALDAAYVHLSHRPARTLAASGTLLAAGDTTGTVHAFSLTAGDDHPRTETLHRGPVTALAALDLTTTGNAPASLLYSGGADGTVRAWAPGHGPMAAPIARRTMPVTALAAAESSPDSGPALAVAWADGRVELHLPGRKEVRLFRPGPPVLALALTLHGLVIGTDERVICLQPR
jgi:hypothetical protein